MAVSEDDVPETEKYWDPIQGKWRIKRGKRKRKRRGSYSVEEKAMLEAMRRLVVAERYMDGELAQYTCADLTVLLIRAKTIIERYSWEATGDDVSGIRHVVAEELDMMPYGADEEDMDVYEEILEALKLPTRARICTVDHTAQDLPMCLRRNPEMQCRVCDCPKTQFGMQVKAHVQNPECITRTCEYARAARVMQQSVGACYCGL